MYIDVRYSITKTMFRLILLEKETCQTREFY